VTLLFIVICYSMGQIIKPVCIWACICLSVCALSHGRISWSTFIKFGTEVINPKSKKEFFWGHYCTTPSPILGQHAQQVLKIQANINKLISASNVCELPKFSHLIRNRVEDTMVMSDFRPDVEICLFRVCIMKMCIITRIYGRIAKILVTYRKSSSRKKMATLD